MYNESGDNMYDFLNGIVDNVYPNGVALDVNGIGFFINTPNPYSFNIGSKEKIYIYQVVREDELSLYGFKTMEERDFFLKLISVKGLGPRMALPILATGSINGISDAIERENYLYLKKFPKIGDKVAKQIVLDLKGKLNDINIMVLTVMLTEKIYALLFALVPLAAMFGYRLFKGKQSKASIGIIIVLSVIGVIVLQLAVATISVAQEYELGIAETASEVVPYFLSADGIGDLLSNSVMEFLFMALGIAVAWKYLAQTNAGKVATAEAVASTLRPISTDAETTQV